MRRQAGFTLLEIMVAIVVFGLLLVGLTQGVQFGLRAWNGQAAMLAQSDDLQAVDTTLRALITQMDPGFAIDPPNIIGLPQAFAFTTELRRGAARDDASHVDVSLSVDPRHEFILRWTEHLHAVRLGGAPVVESTVLLDGVAGVAFSYWDQAGGNGHWVRQWNARTPPSLVRISIGFTSRASKAETPTWPDIVVAPMRHKLN